MTMVTIDRLPNENDDATKDMFIGVLWYSITEDALFMCIDASEGEAVWKEIKWKDV